VTVASGRPTTALALSVLLAAIAMLRGEPARADAPAADAPIAQRRPACAYTRAATDLAGGTTKQKPNCLDAPAADESGEPKRPAILFNRWQEDWSVLVDPNVPREPLDGLKYIRLSKDDPQTYLSVGAGTRDRFEAVDAPNFGVGGSRAEDYVISRNELLADLRVASQLQVFVELQANFAPWKSVITPVDRNPLDLEQAFVTLTEPVGDGIARLRIGRQQIGFDLQRFISVRDGPNNRQSYDAVWAEYEQCQWRITGFYSLPVQDVPQGAFTDFSSNHLTYGGVRGVHKLFGNSQLGVTLSWFTQDRARYLTVTGNERRNIVDVHFSGSGGGFDWDVEGMNQTGRIAPKSIEAWAVGSINGYTFSKRPWSPRLGLQVDAASGNTDPAGGTLGTFNPLFPNGYYFTLAGFSTYVNLIHVKPSITLQPADNVRVALAAAAQWRETTADAVYVIPNIPIAGTAGRPGSYTGTYGQLDVTWQATPHFSLALEGVHFAVADVIRRAGGHNGNYLGVQAQYGW
jgi:Alginate export